MKNKERIPVASAQRVVKLEYTKQQKKMSQQSINLLSKNTFAQEADEIVIYNVEQDFYNKNFKLGSGADIREANYYSKLKESFCINECEIVNYIQNKIDGKLDIKPKKKKLSNYLSQLKEQEGGVIDTANYWNMKLWQKKKK